MRCSVRFFAIALFVFLNFAFLQNSFAQVLKADYQFQNTRSSSVGGAPGLADLIRLAQSCPSYCNTFTTDTVKGESRRVLQFPTDNGLNLQPTTSVLSNNGIYSIAILFKFDTGDTWRRIVEFKNGTGDNGLYVSPTNVLNFFNAPPNGTTAILPGTYYQVVLTRDGSGNLMVYVDGVLQFQFSDSGNDGVMDGNNSLRFFQDNTVSGVTGEASSGAVARIRVFDGALTAGQVGALDCVPAPPGMVAWWPGDGNANDIRGENNGTLQPPSNGTGFAPGEVGHAFTFDGIDDFVSVASTPALDFGTRDFTIDLWVNLNSLTGNQTFFDKTVPGFPNSQTYLVEFNAPDKLRFLVRNTTSNELSLLATVSLQTGTWYHVAAVRQGNTSTIYLDGTQVAQQSSVGPIDTGAGGVATIGRLSETSVRFMSGQIDELEIFSRALAIGEIKGIFNAGSAGKCKPRCTPPPSGMVSWYTGDDNPFDIFGTNHGTLQGGATFADGKAGRAFSLNGTDAFIQVPNNPGLDPTAAGSLDAWVKFNQLPSAANHVMEIVGTGNSGNDFDLQANTNDRFLFSVEDGATATSTTVIQTGVWYHVAGTWDSNSIIIYVNGVLEETNSSSVTRSPGGEQLEIGHKFGSENAFFNGLIDEVEVFDRALSTTEIQAINNAATGTGPASAKRPAWVSRTKNGVSLRLSASTSASNTTCLRTSAWLPA